MNRAASKEGGNVLPVVINCKDIVGADFTAAKVSRRNIPRELL